MRPKIDERRKKKEGLMLRKLFNAAKDKEPTLTQEGLIEEMGLKSPPLFFQWCDGRTNIPDKRLLWLADRLKFDAAKFRPEMLNYSNSSDSLLAEVMEVYSTLTEDDKVALLAQARLLSRAHSSS